MGDRAVDALKWIALASMTIDHINKYLLDAQHPWMFAVGRIAAPLFAMVLGYNLARPGAVASNAAARAGLRLLAWGAVASVPYIGLGKTSLAGGWWPLNVLFALAVASLGIALWSGHHRSFALGLLVVGGALAEFFWPLIGLVLAAHRYARAPSFVGLGTVVLACALLTVINGNGWALVALPMVAVASQAHPAADAPHTARHSRRIFYAYYPLHLAVLWVVRALQDAGS